MYQGFTQEVGALEKQIGQALAMAGCKMRLIERDGVMVAQCVLPTMPNRTVLEVHVEIPKPPGEVGALFHGKFARIAKKIAGKVAHSKLLKKIWKLGPLLAMAIPPPAGEVISTGLAAAQVATRLIKAAKGGHPGASQLLAKGHALLNIQNGLTAKLGTGDAMSLLSSAASGSKKSHARALAPIKKAAVPGKPGGVPAVAPVAEKGAYTVTFPNGGHWSVNV